MIYALQQRLCTLLLKRAICPANCVSLNDLFSSCHRRKPTFTTPQCSRTSTGSSAGGRNSSGGQRPRHHAPGSWWLPRLHPSLRCLPTRCGTRATLQGSIPGPHSQQLWAEVRWLGGPAWDGYVLARGSGLMRRRLSVSVSALECVCERM